eukprot:4049950-Prymnesium_polylepis.1
MRRQGAQLAAGAIRRRAYSGCKTARRPRGGVRSPTDSRALPLPDALHLLRAPLVRIDGCKKLELSVYTAAIQHTPADELAHKANMMR